MYLKLYYLKIISNNILEEWITNLKNETEELILKQKNQWKSKKENLTKEISKAINGFEITFNDYKCSNKCVYYEKTCFKEDGCIPEYAPFTGYPFIWIGSKNEVIELFRKLSDEAKIILEDCAYFWILTDKEKEIENEINFNFKRNIIINWNYSLQNLIYSRLIHLIMSPNLVGLSYELYFVRKKIYDIANGPMGPGSPVLIKGPSGTGKEEVALLLNELSPRDQPLKSIPCAILTESNISLAELYGNAKNAGYGNEKEGYLHEYRDGCILFDDFDAADKLMQEALLRCNSNEPYLPYIFYRYGGGGSEKEKRHTNAWLFFSTNKDIDDMIKKGKFREDFFFRFGARSIELKPLNERYADIPAIIRYVWQELSPSSYFILNKENLEKILNELPKFKKKKDEDIRESLLSLLINSMVINSNDLINKIYKIIYQLYYNFQGNKFEELADKDSNDNDSSDKDSNDKDSNDNDSNVCKDKKNVRTKSKIDAYEEKISIKFKELSTKEDSNDSRDKNKEKTKFKINGSEEKISINLKKVEQNDNYKTKEDEKENGPQLLKQEGPRLSAEDVRMICKENINWKGNVRDVKRLLWYYFRKRKEGRKKVISIETFLNEVINKKKYFESCEYINVSSFDSLSLDELVDNVLKNILTPEGQSAFISVVQKVISKETLNVTLEEINSKVDKKNKNRVKRLIYILEFIDKEGEVSKKDMKNINGFKTMSKTSSTFNIDINSLKDKKLVVASKNKSYTYIKGNDMFVS